MALAELKYDTNPDCFDGVAWALQESWGGVFIAGAAFSLVFTLGLTGWGIAAGSMSVVGFLFMPLMFAVFVVVGLLSALFWSIFALIFVLVLNLALWESFNRRTAVAIFGGATGFLATYWQIFDWANVDVAWGMFSLTGVAMAVLFGQIGALSWAHRRNVFFAPAKSDEADPVSRHQFGIKQLLAATFLFGLLFAADQAVPRHEVLVMAGVYLVLQLIGLALDHAQLFLSSGRSKASVVSDVPVDPLE